MSFWSWLRRGIIVVPAQFVTPFPSHTGTWFSNSSSSPSLQDVSLVFFLMIIFWSQMPLTTNSLHGPEEWPPLQFSLLSHVLEYSEKRLKCFRCTFSVLQLSLVRDHRQDRNWFPSFHVHPCHSIWGETMFSTCCPIWGWEELSLWCVTRPVPGLTGCR